VAERADQEDDIIGGVKFDWMAFDEP